MSPPARIPHGLGERDYAPVWDAIASVPEHAFELVDESSDEAALDASGAQIAPHLRRGLELGQGDVVLEIGCGVARIGRHLAPHVGEWWGLDVSRRMVELARRRCAGLPNVKLFAGRGADLAPIPDASVDKAYCHAVFIHMDKEDWYSYLCEARRVLRPGGLFYFDVWNLCDEAGWLRWQMERALYASRAERPVHRNQFSTPSEVRAMLRHAGLAELHLAETFCVHVVAARPPEGDGHGEGKGAGEGEDAGAAAAL
ncbi:MAG TPA: class I SAM-dependent methyltransferase, partial [Planctomycetota bacterium]|nr:class I SAM-dependent methyltransferase [Planctomycetota bacterium]